MDQPMADISNCDLVLRIAQGDPGAEQTLIARFWPGVLVMLTKRTRDPDSAADLAQETFIKVLKNTRNGDVQDPSAIAGYIQKTAHYTFIQEYRKTQRRDTHPDQELISREADDSPSVIDKLSSIDRKTLVKQLINEVKAERYRELLTLHYVDGAEKAKICSDLDMKPADFDRTISRARISIRKLIEAKLNSPDSALERSDLLTLAFVLALFGPPEPEALRGIVRSDLSNEPVGSNMFLTAQDGLNRVH